MPTVQSKGKPNFFFAPNDADSDWRLTEKIVAVIESFLQPYEPVVFSPMRVRNVVGDNEELDVVFKRFDDPGAPFTFTQVRDRDGPQGRPWIQQLIGQETTLGTGKGTLVSTSGFAETVVELAIKLNIPIRTLRKGTDSDNFGAWFSSTNFRIILTGCYPKNVAVVADNGERATPIDIIYDGEIKGTLLIADHESNRLCPVTPEFVFNRFVLSDPVNQQSISSILDQGGNDASVNVTFIFDSGPYPVSVTSADAQKPLPVLAIVFHVRKQNTDLDVPIKGRFRYENAQDGEVLAEAVVGECEISGKVHYMILVRTSGDEKTDRIGGGFFA